MKKTILVITTLLSLFILFSCAQPTQSEVKTLPEKPVYFLYDNIMLRELDGGQQNRKTGWTLTQTITGKENLSAGLWTDGKYHLNFILDFFFAPNKDLYLLEYDLLLGESFDPSSKIYVKKLTYSKENQGKYSENPEIIFDQDYSGNGYINYSRFAISNDKLFLAKQEFTDYNITSSKIVVYDLAKKQFLENLTKDLGKEYVSSMKVVNGNNLYVASYKIQQDKTYTNSFRKFEITQDNITQKFNENIDYITTSKNEVLFDMQYQNGLLYCIITNFLDGEGKYLGGGIVTIKDNGTSIEVGNIFGYKSEGSSLSSIEYEPPTKETPFFYQPKRFIALAPKKLIIADEGAYKKAGSSDGSTDNQGSNIESTDSVVTVDITNEGLKISDRVIMENLMFSTDWVIGSSLPLNFDKTTSIE